MTMILLCSAYVTLPNNPLSTFRFLDKRKHARAYPSCLFGIRKLRMYKLRFPMPVHMFRNMRECVCVCKNLRSGTDGTDGRHERHTDVSMDDTHTDVRMDDTTTTHIIRTPGHLCHPERSLVHTAECRVGFCQTNMHTRSRDSVDSAGADPRTHTHIEHTHAVVCLFVRSMSKPKGCAIYMSACACVWEWRAGRTGLDKTNV